MEFLMDIYKLTKVMVNFLSLLSQNLGGRNCKKKLLSTNQLFLEITTFLFKVIEHLWHILVFHTDFAV